MSQMYLVSYVLRGEGAERGKVLVCATDKSAAEAMVGYHLKLPQSRLECSAQRCKPSIYQVERQELAQAPISPGVDRHVPVAAPDFYAMTVTSTVRAYSEANAWRRLSKDLVEHASCNLPAGPLGLALEMKCTRLDEPPSRRTRVEENGMFTGVRMFQGGAARPR